MAAAPGAIRGLQAQRGCVACRVAKNESSGPQKVAEVDEEGTNQHSFAVQGAGAA